MRILLLEDDSGIGKWVHSSLSEAGHVVDWVADGREALASAATGDFDVIVLDRMTPGIDGLSVLKAIRASRNTTPVLFLTAMEAVEDRVEGLEAGADDYLTKPFASSELLARIAALGRRRSAVSDAEPVKLKSGDVELDLLKQTCERQGQKIDLNAKEFRLLEVFMRSEGRVLTRAMLLERVWDINFDPTSSVVETHISRLRAKIEKPFEGTLIRTKRGAGYVFEV
ncbi:response regulator transcription factor [uncultured Roseibium sp.]|uniref:response regulator transcription factor n=1 Tax=uncultured Roseibium sp. TaxID=1936171 RepID=UPI002630025F|nr:response regulator transcription factor [uncultured Roseibium sp.]